MRGGSGFSYGAGSRVLALVDGLPVLAADASNIRWQFLPLENIARIEVIKGAASVLYGSSALNGVINFRSARPTTAGKTSLFAESGFFDTPANTNWKWWGNSPRLFNSFSGSHQKIYKGTEVAAGIYLLNDNGYRRLNNELLVRANLNMRRESNHLSGFFYGLNTLIGLTDKRDFLLWENADSGALRQDTSTAINLKATFITIDPFVGLHLGEDQKHDLKMRYQLTDNRFPDSPGNESTSHSLFAEYQFWYRFSQLIQLTSGLAQNYMVIQSPFHGDHVALNVAIFTQADLHLTRRLKMVAGTRIELNRVDNVADKAVPLFRAGINYMALSHTFLRASFGQGYRYPSIAEQFATTTLGAIRIFPNELIKPESGWNAELGLKQGLSFANWDGMGDLAVFYSQNKDMIEYLFGVYPDPVSGVSQPGFRADNTEYSRVYGLETEFMFVKKNSTYEPVITAGYLFTYPAEFSANTFQNTGNYLKYRRKHSVKLGIIYRIGRWEPTADLYYKSKILAIDDVFLNPGTREDILPGFFDYWTENNRGYFLIDFSMAYHLTEVFKISLAVKNLTNTEYMTRPGDIRPHRNFSLRFSASI